MARLSDCAASYLSRIKAVWETQDWAQVQVLAETLKRCWVEGRQVFLCGNGGSSANASHLANDLLYGVDKPAGMGLKVSALTGNASVITCLANDTSYNEVFSRQLAVLGRKGDVLIVFSGSGNSPNILETLGVARKLGVESFAVLGFSGGQCLKLADHAIHFPIDDMQVAEDLQMMVGHMVCQWLYQNRALRHDHGQ